MSTPLTDKSFEGMLRQIRRDITILTRRLGRSSAAPSEGSTAYRDALFGVPATDAARVELANRNILWFNTDTGWQESYYAVDGTSGLTARGLIAGSPAGWYPTGRADTRYMCKTDGFQNIGAAGSSALIGGFVTRRNHGAITVNSNRLVVPRAGVYEITAKAYVTGGQFSITLGFNLSGAIPVTTGSGTLASALMVTTPSTSDESHPFAGEYPLAAGSEIGMAATANGITSGGPNVWGDTNNWGWGTNYRLTYIGPPLVGN